MLKSQISEILFAYRFARRMKIKVQTLTGVKTEVEVDQEYSVKELKVRRLKHISCSRSDLKSLY